MLWDGRPQEIPKVSMKDFVKVSDKLYNTIYHLHNSFESCVDRAGYGPCSICTALEEYKNQRNRLNKEKKHGEL